MRITIFLVFAAVVIGTIMLAEPASACVSNQFCLGYILVSMTQLFTHSVAHSNKPSSWPKTNNQPLKKFLSLELFWVPMVSVY